MSDIKKMKELFESLRKMDPKMSQALANVRAGRGTPADANIIARGMYTDTMVPKMGNKAAYQDHLSRNENSGYHVHADLNDLKQLNTQHTEKGGDEAITKFGHVASEVSRMFGGKSFRNGGDEFKFWFHKPEQAHGFAREVRKRLESHPKIRGTHNLASAFGIGYSSDHAEKALDAAKSTLGTKDPQTKRRANNYPYGSAPTVIHSLTHEPAPEGWKPPKGKPAEFKPKAPAPAPQGMGYHNPLAKMDVTVPAPHPEQRTDITPKGVPNNGSHPSAYEWHDGHTGHHVLTKDEMKPAAHPHADGAIPGTKNDQAAGKGVATYHEFAKDYGTISPGKKTNLFHYDYRPHAGKLDDLVSRHGFKAYVAGGKYGKPDLANRNYNSGHLMIYDPTPGAGGDFGDEHYTKTWRTAHELAHGVTYPALNAKYGEGRRIGKLGTHRTPREAKRAVEWEWMAAHTQRAQAEAMGMHIPDELFHRELNTVMHDAVHRAVTGKFTEPSDEGFQPHSHKVPLEHALGMIDHHARRLGLTHDDALLK